MKSKKKIVETFEPDYNQIIQEWSRYADIKPFVYVTEEFDWEPDDDIEDNNDIDIMLIGSDPNSKENKKHYNRDRNSKHYNVDSSDDEDIEYEIVDDNKPKASITFVNLLPEDD